MNIRTAAICFFIGTEAELIKMFPVIIEAQKRGVNCKIISSGQNDISRSHVLKVTNGGKIDVLISDNSKIKKSAIGLLKWYLDTSRKAIKTLKKVLLDVNFQRSIMVVHGDTISTVMGAKIGRKLDMIVAHVEAGLRSHDFLNPFPEELDRILTSRYAKIHFVPDKFSLKNLKRAKGEKIDTIYNTILDSLKFSQTIKSSSNIVLNIADEEYFVFVIHRQENLVRKEFVNTILNKIISCSNKIKCMMIMHEPTKIALENMGLLNDLLRSNRITIIPRMEYFDFMKVLFNAKFVITDGGSNQEELSYMGKPCLLIRNKTERNDGIGKNVVLYGGDLNKIDEFISNYEIYSREPMFPEISPSKIIVDELEKHLNG